MKLRYAVVFEQMANNYSAYVPDLPGCVSTGKTWEEMQAMIREAITAHLETTAEMGEPIPQPEMSVEDATAHYGEAVSSEALAAYPKQGEGEPSPQAIFQMVEVDAAIPDAAQAG